MRTSKLWKRSLAVPLASAALLLIPAVAGAHVEIVSGPGSAGTTQKIVFGIGHGCAGADTWSVKIDIPAGVTSIRPMRSDFGPVSVETDTAGNVTAITWQKADAELLSSDVAYYELVLRMKVPNAPFTTLYFPAHQTCKAADGTVTTTEWVGTPGSPSDGGTVEPAPGLAIVPAHERGWNKIVTPVALDDLDYWFGDTLIVWREKAAWSTNDNTTALIASTPGVTALTSVKANDELWVRY